MEKLESSVKSTVINFANPSDVKPEPIKQNIHTDYIPFGADNLFPNALARMARMSPNHRGVLNSKTTYMIGGGLISEKDEDVLEPNRDRIPLTKTTKNTIFDYNLSGNGWIEIITDAKRSFIYFNHIDVTKVRLNKEQDMAIIHPNWRIETTSKQLRQVLPIYPNFIQDGNVQRSIYQFKDYEPELTYYGIPLWIAGKDSVEIDLKTNRWNLSRLENSFRTSGLLVVPVTDANEAKSVIDNVEKNFTGEGNNSKLLVIAKTRAKENEKADTTQLIETKQDDDGSWINLHSQSLSDIMISHGWYRSLTSLNDNTGFDTNRILNEYKLALSTSIIDVQNMFTDFYKMVYSDLQNRDIEIGFINKPPLDDYNYHYVWEARQKIGLDFDETKPEQQQLIGINAAPKPIVK
jgi:hypothetical protein